MVGGWEPRTLAREGSQRLLPRTQPLQISRCQAGPSSDPGQHPWSNFLVVVEGEHEVRPAITRECSVRSRLSLDAPADAEKGSQNLSSLGGRPGGHAALKVTFRRSGGASSFSRRSAITRSASA
jgi:hypothetical protein